MPEECKHLILALYRYVISARKDIFYVIGRTGYMDEISLTFDSSSNRIVGSQGAKRMTIKPGHEKIQFTVVFSGCVDGKDKREMH